MNITTTYTTTAKGAGRIVAKGGGKQVTLPVDHGKSQNARHGEAAAALALKVNPRGFDVETVGRATHVVLDDGKHRFTIG